MEVTIFPEKIKSLNSLSTMPKTNPQIVQKANCLNKNDQNPKFFFIIIIILLAYAKSLSELTFRYNFFLIMNRFSKCSWHI